MRTIYTGLTLKEITFVHFSSLSFVCHDFQPNFSSISLLDGMLNETYWGLSHSELNSREVLTKTAYIECITLGTGWASAKPQTFFWLVSFSPLPYLWVLNLTVWVPYLSTCWEVHLIDAVIICFFKKYTLLNIFKRWYLSGFSRSVCIRHAKCRKICRIFPLK